MECFLHAACHGQAGLPVATHLRLGQWVGASLAQRLDHAQVAVQG